VKLATYRNAHPDGRLMVVSRDLTRAIGTSGIAPTLLHALQYWDEVAPGIRRPQR
jgi:fumarylacetoacetate (FAA) hydrolase